MATLWHQHGLFCCSLCYWHEGGGLYICICAAWFGFKMAMGPTMCGISVILYAPCRRVGSLGCRFHADLKHTHTHTRSYLGNWKRVLRIWSYFSDSHQRRCQTQSKTFLISLCATCWAHTSFPFLLTATYWGGGGASAAAGECRTAGIHLGQAANPSQVTHTHPSLPREQ